VYVWLLDGDGPENFVGQVMTALGLLSESMLIAERPSTSFIEKPDGSEALGSAVQLVINLSAIAVAERMSLPEHPGRWAA
jgi:hypothetical protein